MGFLKGGTTRRPGDGAGESGPKSLFEADDDAVGGALRIHHGEARRSPPRRASTRSPAERCRSSTGAPSTIQVRGGTPPDAFSARGAAPEPAARPATDRGRRASRRAGRRSSGAPGSSRRWSWARPGARGAAAAAGAAVVAWSVTGGTGSGSGSPPRRAKASNRIGAATTRPTSPGTEVAIRPADPDADREASVEADRPGVAVAVGGAGLEGDPARTGRCRAAARRAGCRRRTRPPPDRRCGASARRERRASTATAGEGRHVAAARQADIEPRQVRERDAEAAEPDGEAGRGVAGQRDRRRRPAAAARGGGRGRPRPAARRPAR